MSLSSRLHLKLEARVVYGSGVEMPRAPEDRHMEASPQAESYQRFGNVVCSANRVRRSTSLCKYYGRKMWIRLATGKAAGREET
jgi:hypothetical protein